jgi:hypothetical protein
MVTSVKVRNEPIMSTTLQRVTAHAAWVLWVCDVDHLHTGQAVGKERVLTAQRQSGGSAPQIHATDALGMGPIGWVDDLQTGFATDISKCAIVSWATRQSAKQNWGRIPISWFVSP